MAGEAAYTPTKQVYVDALRLCLRAQLRTRRFRGRLILAGVIAGTAVGAVIALMERDILVGMTTGLTSAFIGMATALVIIWSNYLLLPRRGGRLFDQDRSMGEPIEFEWDDARAEWRTGSGSFRAAWREHHRWTADDKALLFFANDQLYRFIPAAALTPEQRSELERLLTQNGVPRL